MIRTGKMRRMRGPGRLLRALIPILAVSIGNMTPSSAEPIACLRGQKGCGEAVIEKKVQISFDRAASVFVGQLESIQDSGSGGRNTRIFTFQIGKQYKGALAGNVARVSIDSYLTGGKLTGAGPQKSLGEFEQLEAAAEAVDTEKVKNRYLERVASLRDEIKHNGADDPALTHVVQLDLYIGDLSFRHTDIAMRIGERYAVFVLDKSAFAPDPKEDTGKFSSWIFNPVDLYSMNGERGHRALAALEQAASSHGVSRPAVFDSFPELDAARPEAAQ